MTGSAIAIPLLGAASAHAADGTTWDKVAECESGGSWSADRGNGYFGGLQISQEDWDRYGGGQYAESANQASRSQQISVAEKILADRGTTPWATCALLSGLTSDSASLDVDTGVDESGDAQGSGDSSGSGENSNSSDLPDSSPSAGPSSDSGADAGSSGGAHAKKPSPGRGKDGAADAGADSNDTSTPRSDKSASPETGDAGRAQGADGAPVVEPGADNSDNSLQDAGSWSLVDTGALDSGGRHRGKTADESVTNGQNAASSGRHASREPGAYTVHEGDSLASIADSQDVDGGWRALYADNEKVIGADPNHITAGQTLEIGTETDAD